MTRPPEPPVEGHCDTRFADLRAAFHANLAREDELGAAVCAIVDGRLVADLWGGWTHREDDPRRRPWSRDTLVNAYSAGKGPLAMLALRCVEAGAVDLDAPLSRPWPELVAARTPALTLRVLLAHRAGLPAVAEPLPDAALWDWDRMCQALAAQEPWWEPGTAHGYHVNTLGLLVGEVLRRATGERVEALLREHLTGPLDVDFSWGVLARARERVAPIAMPFPGSPASPPTPPVSATGSHTGGEDDPALRALRHAVYFNPPGFSGFGTVDTPAWRDAVLPSTNAHTHARALARLYDAFTSGAAGVGPALRAEATRTHAEGPDRVLGRPNRFGLVFQLPQERRPLGPGPHAFGHFGWGGSLGLADAEARVAFGYVTNCPGERFRTPRPDRLLAALYAGL